MAKPSARAHPPGPRRTLPLAGLLAYRRGPLPYFQNLARQYGDISYFKIGPQEAFFLNHPDLIKDVLVTNNNGPVRLFLNESRPQRPWLSVALRGGGGENSHGLGARIGLVRRGRPTAWRRARTDGSYLTASDPRVHFGLGDASEVDALLVEWPRGRREAWLRPRVNLLVTLREGEGKPWPEGMR